MYYSYLCDGPYLYFITWRDRFLYDALKCETSSGHRKRIFCIQRIIIKYKFCETNTLIEVCFKFLKYLLKYQ